MKNLSLILNGILIIAVAILFYLHFSSKPSSSPSRPDVAPLAPGSSTSIVYVNIDTLLNNYLYFHDLSSEFEKKQAQLEAQLNSRSRAYETNALDYQNKVQKGLVTRREAAELEQQLLQEQQDLLNLRDQLTMELAEEEQVGNRKLIDKIMEYLKVYNQDYGYQFIFSTSFGSNVLFANEQLNITYSVLEGLNAQYAAEQENK